MDEKLKEIFPEFDLIDNQELQQKTMACWREALGLGNWRLEDLDMIPFTLLIPNCPVSLRVHVQAVTQTAVAVAKVLRVHYNAYYTLKIDYVVAGGLLHDIGKLLEYKKKGGKYVKSDGGKLLRHPFRGAALATKHGLPDDVIHIIATHAKEGDMGYRSPEAVIVHHADFTNFEPLVNK